MNDQDVFRRAMEGVGCTLGEVKQSYLLRAIGMRFGLKFRVALVIHHIGVIAINWKDGSWAPVTHCEGKPAGITNLRLQQLAQAFCLPDDLRHVKAQELLAAIVGDVPTRDLIAMKKECPPLLRRAVARALARGPRGKRHRHCA